MAIFLSDSFSRSNSTTLGGSWTNVYGTNSIYNGAAVPIHPTPSTTITRNASIISNPYYTNYEVTFNVKSTTTTPRPIFRHIIWYKDLANYAYVQLLPSTTTATVIIFGKISGINGSDTNLNTVVSTKVSLDIDNNLLYNRIVVDGRNVKVYRNNTDLVGNYTYSESDYAATSGAYSGIGWSAIPINSTAEDNYNNNSYLDFISFSSSLYDSTIQWLAAGKTSTGVGLVKSADGSTWSAITSTGLPAATDMPALAYGDDKYLCTISGTSGGTLNGVYSSLDGIAWTNLTYGAIGLSQKLLYKDNLWVALRESGSGGGYIYASYNDLIGANGIYLGSPGLNPSSIAYGDNNFIVGTKKSSIVVSQNSVRLVKVTPTPSGPGIVVLQNIDITLPTSGSPSVSAVIYNEGTWLVLAQTVSGSPQQRTSYFITSTNNFTTWNVSTTPVNWGLIGAGAYANNLWIVSGRRYNNSTSTYGNAEIAYSSDLTNWSYVSTGFTSATQLAEEINSGDNKILISNNITNEVAISSDTTPLSFTSSTATGLTLVRSITNTFPQSIPDPTLSLSAARDNTNNRAILVITPVFPDPTFLTEFKIQYKLTDLNSEWIDLDNPLSLGNQTTYHTNANGYFTNGNLQYRLRVIYNNEEYFSNTVTLTGGVKLARYDATKTVTGFKIDELIHNETTNQIEVTFRLPQPTTLSNFLTAVRAFQYRMTDIKTGTVVNASSGNQGENVVSQPYAVIQPLLILLEQYPVTVSTDPAKLLYKLTFNNVITEFVLGEKGIRIEWGWTELMPKSSLPTTFTKDTENYGYLVFYPKYDGENPVLPPGDDVEHKPDSNQGGTGGNGQTTTPVYPPFEPPVEPPGTGVIDPIDVKPVIIVTPIEDGQICLVDENGINLACGILPLGTPPNPFITIRKENDNIYIIYDGRVIVSYKIDPVKFPNLQNSQGWIGFFDVETEEQIDAPEGSTVSWLPEEGSDYEVNPYEIEYGLSRKIPFIYGTYEQGYTLIINGTNVRAEMEPLHDDLIAADFYISGGTTVRVSPELATIIANAGYGRYLSVVR